MSSATRSTSRRRDAVPALALGLCAAIAAVVFARYLSCRAAYLFTDVGNDSVNEVYPKIKHLFDYLASTGLPGWSFNAGLGRDIYPFGWNDPFYALLFLFRGARLPFGFGYMEAAKTVLAGAFFCSYARRLGLSGRASALAGVLYAFSGYLVLGGAWGVFSTEAVYGAALLDGLERALAGGSALPLAFATALTAALQPFFVWTFGLALAPYAALRPGKRARAAAAAGAGLLASAALSLPEIAQMLAARRAGLPSGQDFFALSSAKVYWTELARLFGNDLLGTGWGFTGSRNYLEAPEFYGGLSALILAPQAFALAAPAWRRRASWLALLLVPAVFPIARRAFWAFSGEYFRSYSLFVAAALITLAARAMSALSAGAKPRRGVLAATLGAALLALFALPTAGPVAADPGLRLVAAGLLVSYAGLVFVGRPAALWALLALACVEAAGFSYITVNSRSTLTAERLSARVDYNDATLDAAAWLAARDASFYRVEKDYPSSPAVLTSYNDALVQGYRGTSEYWSFTQPGAARFSAELGLIDPAKDPTARYLPGFWGRDGLLSLGAVKYLLSRDELPGRKRLARFGEVNVYENRDWLPLGFTLERCLPAADFRRLPRGEKDFALLDAAVRDDCAGWPAASPRRAALSALVAARRRETFSPSEIAQNRLTGAVSAARRATLFLSIPFDRGWSARLDGRPAALEQIDFGFTGLAVEPGAHALELTYSPPWRALGAWLSVCGLLGLALLARPRASAS